MKIKILILLILIVIISIFTGCIPKTELNEREIVQGIGIDLKEDKYLLTIQVFTPEGGGGKTNIDASKTNAKIIESEGETITEAMEKASLEQGKKVFFGNNRVLIIGKELAISGIDEIISFFLRDYESSRPTVDVLVADNTAKEILSTNINQGIVPAETIEKLIQNTQKLGKSNEIQFLDLVKNIVNHSDSATIPIIKINKNDEKQNGDKNEEKQNEDKKQEESEKGDVIPTIPKLQISETALFKKDKMIGILNSEETEGLMWIRNLINQSIITTQISNIPKLSLIILQNNTEIIPNFNGNDIKFNININAKSKINEADLPENQSISQEEQMDEICKKVEIVIQEICQQTLNKAIKEYGVDIFNFGNIIWKKNPEFWIKIKDNWENIISEINFNFNIKVEITKLGLEPK